MPSTVTDLLQASLIGEALDDGPALVFVADEHMRYLAVNSYACEVLGYTREELLSLSVPDIAVAPEAADVYAHMLRRSTDAGVTSIRRKDGELLNMRYTAKETKASAMTFWVSLGFIES
jgi:PAS domain S-box-containing protein